MPDDLKKMKAHFEKRTMRHIELTQKYCKLINDKLEGFDGIVERGEEHDKSKYSTEELDPYIWLTWRYKCADDGVECNMPKGMKEKIDKATERHVVINSHHPEAHVAKALISKKNRPLDVAKMPDLDIAEMVADWCAMSEERGGTPRAWANKSIGVTWKFTPEQEKLIYRIIKAIW